MAYIQGLKTNGKRNIKIVDLLEYIREYIRNEFNIQ